MILRFFANRALLACAAWNCFRVLSLVLGASSLLAATRPPWTSNRVAGAPNPPAPYTVERLFPKLAFTNPVDIALLPGSDRILLLEQGGKLYSFPAQAGVEREHEHGVVAHPERMAQVDSGQQPAGFGWIDNAHGIMLLRS